MSRAHKTPLSLESLTQALTIVVMGASGDLAKKKTYPTLHSLYIHGFFPDKIRIVGYARSKLTKEELVSSLCKYIKATTGTL